MALDKKLLYKVLEGLSDSNIRFADIKKLLQNLGFGERTKGGHHIFFREHVDEIINLQSRRDGKEKPYQVKQVRNLILKYALHRKVADV